VGDTYHVAARAGGATASAATAAEQMPRIVFVFIRDMTR
jgi:hypothetical protein